jgi:hypothetical protein
MTQLPGMSFVSVDLAGAPMVMNFYRWACMPVLSLPRLADWCGSCFLRLYGLMDRLVVS